MTALRLPPPTFVEVPVHYQSDENLENENLGLEQDPDSFTEGTTWIRPDLVAEFHPVGDNKEYTRIFTTYGARMWIYLDVDRFREVCGFVTPTDSAY